MTPAVEALRAAGVAFDLLTYEHHPGAGLAVAVVPVTSRLDPKALARALAVKRVTMAEPAVTMPA